MDKSYRFRGHVYCGRCTVEVVHDALYALPLMEPLNVEVYLDRVAHFRNVDRTKGWDFSDTDFPKPFVGSPTNCHKCRKAVKRYT